MQAAQHSASDRVNAHCIGSFGPGSEALTEKTGMPVSVAVVTENLENSFPWNGILTVPDDASFPRTLLEMSVRHDVFHTPALVDRGMGHHQPLFLDEQR